MKYIMLPLFNFFTKMLFISYITIHFLIFFIFLILWHFNIVKAYKNVVFFDTGNSFTYIEYIRYIIKHE